MNREMLRPSVHCSVPEPEMSIFSLSWARQLRTWILALVCACSGGLAFAQPSNGGFESGDFTGWIKSNYSNPGLTGTPPFSGANIVRNSPGTMSDLTFIRTAGTDPSVALNFPLFGTYCAVVNFGGAGTNANSLKQTFSLTAGMVDPADNLIHVRFAFAPVLENPPHSPEGQPYFYVGLTDNDAAGAVLYDNLNFAQAAGIWVAGGGYVFTDWQVKDITLPLSSLGHSVSIEFIGAGCSAGGHEGHLYVDGLSNTYQIQGLWVSGVADKTLVNPGDTITYTYTVRNDSTVTQNNVSLTATVPAQTTFSASSGLGAIGALAPGATHIASLTVTVNAGATGHIVHDDYFTSSTESPKLYGSTLTTPLMGLPTDLQATLTAGAAACNQVQFQLTAHNAGPSVATAAQATLPLPANATFVSASSSQGSAVGANPVVAHFGDLASGSSATLTVVVSFSSGTSMSTTGTVAGNFVDSTPANDSASATFTSTAALALGASPTGGSILVGNTFTFNVSSTNGWGSPTHQWYLGTSGDLSNPISGATSASYTTPVQNVVGSYSYWARISDACGHVDSAAAVLTVFNTHTVLASSGGNGTALPATQTITHGDPATATFTPSGGYHLGALSDTTTQVGGTSQSPASPLVNRSQAVTYTINPLNADHTLAATFARNQYTLGASAGANGSVFSGGTQTGILDGDNAGPVVFRPSPGYHVTSLAVQLTDYTGTVTNTTVNSALPVDRSQDFTYTPASVHGDLVIVASFAINQYTITASTGAHGWAVTGGSQTVPHGSDATKVLIRPNPGYHLVSITVQTTDYTGAVNSTTLPTGHPLNRTMDFEYTPRNVQADYLITCAYAINVYTISVQVDSNGSGAPSIQTVNHGDSAALVLTPRSGYHVKGYRTHQTDYSGISEWLRDTAVPSPINASRSFPTELTAVMGDLTIVGIYEINTYTVTGQAAAGGKVLGAAVQTVTHGGSASLVFQADPGLRVATVSGCFGTPYLGGGGILGSYTYQAGPVTSDCMVTATFAPYNLIIIPSAGAHGSISPSSVQSVLPGASSGFVITPDSGYRIADVRIDGRSIGVLSSYTFSAVQGDHTISVIFDQVGRFSIATNPGNMGNITPTVAFADPGGCAKVVITPDRGYHVADVKVDGVSKGALTEVDFANITAHHLVEPSFAPNLHWIKPQAATHGSITPAANQSVPYDQRFTITVTPDPGYEVEDLLIDGRSVGRKLEHILTNVRADHTVQVKFRPLP